VNIAAEPRNGEANDELLEYLQHVLQVKKSQLSLDKGNKSRNKIVRVEGF
jgi:uncharacterized protein YggU (UPF0235/DUF167 family)